jgi:hypothetical protein
MIRKMVLSASVVMMAATAFGATGERSRVREEEGREKSRAGAVGTARVADENTIALRQAAAADAATKSVDGVILQALVMDPASKGIDAEAQKGVDELADRVVAGQPIETALSEMGIDKLKYEEKCK